VTVNRTGPVPDRIEPCPIQVDAIGLIIWLWWKSSPPNDFRVRVRRVGWWT